MVGKMRLHYFPQEKNKMWENMLSKIAVMFSLNNKKSENIEAVQTCFSYGHHDSLICHWI